MDKNRLGILLLVILSACSTVEKVDDRYLWLEAVEGEEALA